MSKLPNSVKALRATFDRGRRDPDLQCSPREQVDLMPNKTNPRAKRLGEQIQRELTELLRREVKDERIGNVTITAVNVSGDLRTARVYYLVFGKEGPTRRCSRG